MFWVLQHHTPSRRWPSRSWSSPDLCPNSIRPQIAPLNPQLPESSLSLSLLPLLHSWWLFFLVAFSGLAACRLYRVTYRASAANRSRVAVCPLTLTGIPSAEPGSWPASSQIPPLCSPPRELSTLQGPALLRPLIEWQYLATGMFLWCVLETWKVACPGECIKLWCNYGECMKDKI